MPEKLRIVLLYLLLVIGAVMNIEGSFASIMVTIASWMLIGFGIWIAFECVGSLASQEGKWRRFFWLVLGIVVATWLLEWLGVHTALVFGHYQYHEMLRPQVAGVPLAIGFSWLTLLLSAAGLERRLPFRADVDRIHRRSLTIALLLLVFDVVLEPSAVKLGYWRWQSGLIPWTNYLSWFGIGWTLAYISLRLGFWRNHFPRIVHHFYLAQMIYFGLAYLG